MDTINPNKKYIKEVYSVFNDIKNKLYEQKNNFKLVLVKGGNKGENK